MSMELVMNTDLSKALPQAIDFNYEELKKQLPERLTYYKNLVVTEDSIKSAKADKSALNKLKTAFEDARKDVKRECLKPYEDFELKEKELVDMIEEAIGSIDSQIKDFDEQRKNQKKNEILNYYTENIGEFESLLPLKKIWNSRWLNVSYKMSAIEKEIADVIFKVKNDISIIKTMKLECEHQMLNKYLETLDMSEAMAEKTRFEEQQKRLKEYEVSQKKAQEEAKCKTAEVRTVEPTSTEEKACVHDFIEPKPADNSETTYIPEPEQLQEITKTISVTFKDTTTAFRHELHDVCVKHGVKYGWAKKEDLQ